MTGLSFTLDHFIFQRGRVTILHIIYIIQLQRDYFEYSTTKRNTFIYSYITTDEQYQCQRLAYAPLMSKRMIDRSTENIVDNVLRFPSSMLLWRGD